MTLQLAPSVGRACALVNATINHGGIKLLIVKVPLEDHFGDGAWIPHYFQAHTVIVIAQLPLRYTLRSIDYAGRIAKWGTILGSSDIKYMPRTFVKGLVLAGLVAQFAEF